MTHPHALRLALGLSLITLGQACAKKPTAQETLPQLKAAIAAPVSSPEQNREHSELARLVSEEGYLEGLTRDEVAAKIGPGDRCSRHPRCGEQGFESDDWYYEVGSADTGPQPIYVRYRPVLIVGFNRFGKVQRTYVLHVQ
jgi:hypothetical protein